MYDEYEYLQCTLDTHLDVLLGHKYNILLKLNSRNVFCINTERNI